MDAKRQGGHNYHESLFSSHIEDRLIPAPPENSNNFCDTP
jgi:hypothetical protein